MTKQLAYAILGMRQSELFGSSGVNLMGGFLMIGSVGAVQLLEERDEKE